MELFEKVSKDIVAAMKAKDKVTLEALRNIKKDGTGSQRYSR